ncbi:hypothetical protein [Nocardioides houyundeii]|uniref:hypothetical protein n=1 Tax=Nocardioides houyundeii TaxID=2045452 RepID=UPI000DF46A3B|nr:hypothetical protein [Nocardioides houyundeii]
MLLTKASLCGLLLEEGEEDLAVLLARSDLAEQLDTVHDARALASIGLGEEELRSLLPAIEADPDQVVVLSHEEVAAIKHTLSDRWAFLVDVWLSRGGEPPRPTSPPAPQSTQSVHHA